MAFLLSSYITGKRNYGKVMWRSKTTRILDCVVSLLHVFLVLQVAGGDGTAGWLLGVVSDLKLSHPPPIATVPLGTGNNLPFAFGWVGRTLLLKLP